MADIAVMSRPPARGGLVAWARRNSFQLALVLPLMAYIIVLTVAPILDTFRLSFSQPDTGLGSLESYRTVWSDPVFRSAIVNTVIVAVISLVLEISVGLGVALALHAKFFGRGFVRTVLLIPLGVPTIVSGALMLLIFARSGYMNSVAGAVSSLLDKLPGFNIDYQNVAWTVAGGWRTLLTIAIADMWKVLPIVTLIFLAGLQSIPEDVNEAADVDGATKWQRFSRITLPLLVPYITMALILRAIDAFRIFELALVLAGRIAPVLGTYIAGRYLPPTSDLHTAAAGSIVLFAIIMLFIVLYLKLVAARAEVVR